jgi:2-C-methyl-D-erythritol 2,4-cyclodiphosphate synthase
MRVGVGFDVHAFDESRYLVLGGVTIDGAPGLAGWSDADVLCHAIVDALLGAAGLGDLGSHFPDEKVPEGSSSLELLSRAAALLDEAGYSIANIDSIVAIQDVAIGGHRDLMQKRIAATLGISPTLVNVKATTTDRLGFVGRGEGATAMAVALVEEKSSR